MRKRLLIIGLDAMSPDLAFDRWASELPTLHRLRTHGIWGLLESTLPPITVPAWATMVTSQDPGTLGIYGFRNRKDHTYHRMELVSSHWLREKTVWDYLGLAGKTSIVIGVPPSYPPRSIHGSMISCLLTPSAERDYTFPKSLKPLIEKKFGTYLFDVPNFQTHKKSWLLDQIYRLGEQRFEIVKWLIQTQDWDFFMFVDMGIDRMQHGFWGFMDPEHPKYEPGNPYENAVHSYYRFVDQKLEELLDLLENLEDPVDLMIVSDHGAQRMKGGFAIYEWLIQEGYLRLHTHPQGITRLTPEMIDWQHTIAWSEGGYYARIFLNVKGREPQGTVDPRDYEKIRDELTAKFLDLTDEEGRPFQTEVYRPEEIYHAVRNVAPDLMVFFGDLAWRAIGSVGYGQVWVPENDTGPDDANHARHGVFVMYGPSVRSRPEPLKDLIIYDIGATVLAYFGIEPTNPLRGKPIPYGGG